MVDEKSILWQDHCELCVVGDNNNNKCLAGERLFWTRDWEGGDNIFDSLQKDKHSKRLLRARVLFLRERVLEELSETTSWMDGGNSESERAVYIVKELLSFRLVIFYVVGGYWFLFYYGIKRVLSSSQHMFFDKEKEREIAAQYQDATHDNLENSDTNYPYYCILWKIASSVCCLFSALTLWCAIALNHCQ